MTASRSAAFRIAGVVNRKSPFTGPVRCEVSLFHLNVDTFTAYQETISEPATFNGNTGSCNVTVPFRWPTPTFASVVLIVATVYTDCSRTGTSGTEAFRCLTFEFPAVVLPAEGTMRFLGFSVDM